MPATSTMTDNIISAVSFADAPAGVCTSAMFTCRYLYVQRCLAVQQGIEPPTCGFGNRRSALGCLHFRYVYLLLPIGPLEWQGRRESNPQPAVLETAALPIELLPCK